MDHSLPTTGSNELGAGAKSKEVGEESSCDLMSFYEL